MDQRLTNHPRIATGVTSRSVHRNACGSRTSVGSRTSTQRIGAGGNPAMIPDRRSGRDLEDASFIAIPIWHRQSGPTRLLIFESLGELWQPTTLFGRSSLPTGMAFRRRLKQTGVEPQSCDETDMAANCGDQIEGREAGSLRQRRSCALATIAELEEWLGEPSRSAFCDGAHARYCNVRRGPEWSGKARPNVAAPMGREPWPLSRANANRSS